MYLVLGQKQNAIFMCHHFYRLFWGNVLFLLLSQNAIHKKTKLPYRIFFFYVGFSTLMQTSFIWKGTQSTMLTSYWSTLFKAMIREWENLFYQIKPIHCIWCWLPFSLAKTSLGTVLLNRRKELISHNISWLHSTDFPLFSIFKEIFEGCKIAEKYNSCWTESPFWNYQDFTISP